MKRKGGSAVEHEGEGTFIAVAIPQRQEKGKAHPGHLPLEKLDILQSGELKR